MRSALLLPLALLVACAPDPVAPSRPAVPSPVPVPMPAPPMPAPAPPADPAQKFADLGTCALESGEKIEACRIGYRTFGTLDAAKSNAVLFPTWFSGTTKSLVDIVPDKLVDTKRFYLILVDALGDGV
ncbi:hypothetical protein BH11MYX4_BH11MYX4_49480 [soil metagenome]